MVYKALRTAGLTLCALVATPLAINAQEKFPSRPISIVVPAPAGGPTDTVARILAEAIGDDLGQRFLIQNVGGAGGTIGTAQVAVLYLGYSLRDELRLHCPQY